MIAVRQLTTADEVFANAKRVRDAFFAPRPTLRAQVTIPAEHAANDPTVAPVTPEPQVGSRGTSAEVSEEVAAILSQMKALQDQVADLKTRLAREEDEAAYHFTMAEIRTLVMQEFRVSRLDLESPRKPAPLAHARFALMWLLRGYTPHSLPAIGRFLGDRHHTTIMHGLDQCERLMATNAAYRDRVQAVEACLAWRR